MYQQNKKVALVTGASSGIGRAIYLQLIKQGWIVYGTSRTIEKDKIIKLDDGFMIYLDVNKSSSAENAISAIIKKEGRLDALINNAGYGIAGAIEDTDSGEALAQFDTNFFGVLRLIRLTIPMLRASQGIIINISSVAGILSIPFQSMYSASKAAMESMSEALRMELKDDNIRVCLIEPGDTRTEFTQNRKWVKKADSSMYKAKAEASLEKMAKDEQNGTSPQNVAKVICNMINKKNPPVRRAIGLSYQLLLFVRRFLPDRFIIWLLGKMYA